MNLRGLFILIGLCGGFACGAMAQEGSQMPVRLTLKDALQSVDAINLQVMMANARLEQAIARIAQAQSALLPHIDGLAGGGDQGSGWFDGECGVQIRATPCSGCPGTAA